MNHGSRLLIYSHDSFGLGHLRRCRAIAHHLVERFKHLSVLILSGSPIIGSFDFRSRVDFVRVPGVIKLRNGEYTALNLHLDIDKTLEMSFLNDEARAQIERGRADAIAENKDPVRRAGQAVTGFATSVFGYCFLAAVFMLFAMAMGGKIYWWQALSATVYAAFPFSVLRSLLNTLILFLKDPADIHPMEAKKQLAARIVERYHGAEAAARAREDFELRFSKKDLEQADLPQVSLEGVGADIVSAVVAAYAQGFQITKSRGDARRLVEQGSIQLNGEKVADPKAAPTIASGAVLKLDKTRAVRIA